jgi:hypothetical protein
MVTPPSPSSAIRKIPISNSAIPNSQLGEFRKIPNSQFGEFPEFSKIPNPQFENLRDTQFGIRKIPNCQNRAQ